MLFLNLTLPTLGENLALDEALLDEAEAANRPSECLRLWESADLAVILGRSSRAANEANLSVCQADGVPVLRRCSGGCAVVIGPGCLMYSVVLSYELRPELHSLDEAHRFVLTRVAQATGQKVTQRGISDLALRGQKVSGNSLRCKRGHLLYHGTLLYAFGLEKVGRYLLPPPREPEYRAGRSHEQFVANLPLDPFELRRALQSSFSANEVYKDWPATRVAQLIAERYGKPTWHFER